ncbi:MAG TPA: hypothetical protein VHX39_13810 [Acetobacteraceae bacterium]|nr:hypothetical protein [Acetobacteraceae bacterium]
MPDLRRDHAVADRRTGVDTIVECHAIANLPPAGTLFRNRNILPPHHFRTTLPVSADAKGNRGSRATVIVRGWSAFLAIRSTQIAG